VKGARIEGAQRLLAVMEDALTVLRTSLNQPN
jgi:hypothetical protein